MKAGGPKLQGVSMFFLKKSLKRAAFAGLVLVLLAAVFAGCDSNIADDDINIQGTLPAVFHGTWEYIPSGSDVVAESYIIDENTLRYISHDEDYSAFDSDYTAAIRFVSNYSSNSGVIIVEYTSGNIWGFPYDEDYPFTATYYRNLGGNTVQLANAYDASGLTETATLDEAIAKFTRSKMDTYVSWSYVQPQTKKTP